MKPTKKLKSLLNVIDKLVYKKDLNDDKVYINSIKWFMKLVKKSKGS